MSEAAFVKLLLADQPFVPKYFGGAVELNRKGAPDFEEALKQVPKLQSVEDLEPDLLVIDTRNGSSFKAGHMPTAINLQKGGKFDTWLGSIVAPGEPFYLIAETETDADWLLRRAAAIGYEGQIQGYLVATGVAGSASALLDVDSFLAHSDDYTIVDIRNTSEHEAGMLFTNALPIPLPELRERLAEIPAGKPVVVHCAAGYRSAAGQSIVAAARPDLIVYDLGEAIKQVKAPQLA
jgi:rhodanese-related sulfurtransferase